MHYVHKFILEWNSTCFGQFLYPKHVEFHSKNKFVKSVNLVGFIIKNIWLFCQTRSVFSYKSQNT